MRTRAPRRPYLVVLFALGTMLLLPGCPCFTRADRAESGEAAPQGR